MTQLYDTIGHGYRETRRPDPRIEHTIVDALGDAESVLNVGAGAGSYEPADRRVVAVEPSRTMIAQRAVDAAPVVRATAGALPFPDASFDASLAILTLHHWPDAAAGMRELRRTARRRVVVLTHDPTVEGFWLLDYCPEIRAIDLDLFPTRESMERELGPCTMSTVPVPHDCTDGFLGAYWRRPDAYLDERVRAGISAFALRDYSAALARLRNDLESGAWLERYGSILHREHIDLGYRLIVS